MSKKPDTLNQLDEKFQLKEGDDPEKIFPEEYEMIKEIRQKRPHLEKESDKWIVTFLCARRHNMEDTLHLLDKYCAKKKELGFENSFPTYTHDADLKKHLDQAIIMQIKHGVDKSNRMCQYVFVCKDKPKDRPINVLLEYCFWETEYQIRTEPLEILRNGTTMIIDFKGFSLSNVDFSAKGVEFSKALSGVFPKRIRKVYLFNGGWLLNLIFGAAKMVLSRKLTERVESGTPEGLKNLIDAKWLLTEYGGDLDASPKDWIESIKDEEKRWAKPGTGGGVVDDSDQR